MVGFPNNHGVFLLKMISTWDVLGVPTIYGNTQLNIFAWDVCYFAWGHTNKDTTRKLHPSRHPPRPNRNRSRRQINRPFAWRPRTLVVLDLWKMVQKSCKNTHLTCIKSPVNNGRFSISTGAGFMDNINIFLFVTYIYIGLSNVSNLSLCLSVSMSIQSISLSINQSFSIGNSYLTKMNQNVGFGQ